jgi:hypothetical protein
MNIFPVNFKRAIGCFLLVMVDLVSIDAWTQTNPVTEKPVTLNLDDKKIAKELLKEDRVNDNNSDKSETIKVEPNELDASFNKAEKHGLKPDIVEMNGPGGQQRVTKVIGADGAYCVYSPAVARTDGIDEIQNGLQNQVRTCPP